MKLLLQLRLFFRLSGQSVYDRSDNHIISGFHFLFQNIRIVLTFINRDILPECFRNAKHISKIAIFCSRNYPQRQSVFIRFADRIFFCLLRDANQIFKLIIYRHITIISCIPVQNSFLFHTFLLIDQIYYRNRESVFSILKWRNSIDCHGIVNGKVCFRRTGNPFFFIHTLCDHNNRIK